MRSASIFVIIRSCKLTSLLPFVFPPVYTTMSSTSGEVPAKRRIVGSIWGYAASEEPHIILQMISFFSFGRLPTQLSSSTCIPIQITHETASSSTSGKLPREGRNGTDAGGDSKEGQDRWTGGQEEEGDGWTGVLRRGLGGTSKKKCFLDLFQLSRKLGLKFSLNNKTWRKKTRKKWTTSIPFLMSKLVKNMPRGPFFNLQRIASH